MKSMTDVYVVVEGGIVECVACEDPSKLKDLNFYVADMDVDGEKTTMVVDERPVNVHVERLIVSKFSFEKE